MKKARATLHAIKTIAAAMVLCVMLPVNAVAQNNKFKINDKLYPLYVAADKKRTTEEGLRLAKEMYNKAVELGDKKAQCIALSIPLNYYSANDDEAKFMETVSKMKAVSRKNGYPQYYYFAWQRQIGWLMDDSKLITALGEIEKMHSEATAENYELAISTCYRLLGNLYIIRNDYENAEREAKAGLEYFKEHVKGQDPTNFYILLSRVYSGMNKEEEALKYVEEGLKYVKIGRNKVNLNLQKAVLQYRLGRMDEFSKTVEWLENKEKEYSISGMPNYTTMKVYSNVVKQNFVEAMAWADKSPTERDKQYLYSRIYAGDNQWRSAYKSYNRFHELQSEYNSKLQSSAIAEQSELMRNEQLRARMFEEQAKNATLLHERDQAEMEKERIELAQQVMKDRMAREELASAKELALQQKALSETQLEVEKARYEQTRARNRAIFAFLVIGLVVTFAAIFNLIRNKRKSKRFIETLTEKNEELIVARDRAEQSERLKTQFIQNISHEIRTPLNAIVGFSGLLTDEGMGVGDEEKKDFSRLISHNADLLTGLVNDVLTLSELQSGKAQLYIAPCRVNELCRMALDTVSHRKPEGVELRFTTDVTDNFTVDSDSRRISQVLINFLTNAEKYTTKGSITLDCSTAKGDGYVTFTVTDTGCGIPKEKQEQIFGRFEKLDEFHQGIGLGLNICMFIADMLQARMGIDSEYTQGARFYFAVKIQ